MDLDEEVSRAAIQLLGKEPFFAHVFGSISRRASEKINTCGVSLVDGGVELVMNPGFFLSELRAEGRVAVLKHEILHIVLGHLTRWDKNRNQLLQNIAMDLVVNQFVAPWRLPKKAVTIADFEGFPPDKAWEHYYDLLLAMIPPKQLNLLVGQMIDSQDDFGKTGGESESAGAAAQESISKIVKAGRHGIDSHEGFEEAAHATEGERAVAQESIWKIVDAAQARAEASRNHGTLPGFLIEELERLRQGRKAVIDWRRTLRLFSSSCGRSLAVGTMMRPSRRYGSFPGIRMRLQRKLLVAVDTSGSVSARDLADFFAEIRTLWRTGTEILMIECDAAIGATYPYKGQVIDKVTGRGGTDFNPVMDFAREQKRHYDGLVYLTDGYAPCPERGPWMKLLWVLSSDGDSRNLEIGQVKKIDR